MVRPLPVSHSCEALDSPAFPAPLHLLAEWKPVKVDDASLWEEDWDKDDTSTSFSQQLRATIKEAKQQQETANQQS